MPSPSYCHRGDAEPLRWNTTDEVFRETVRRHGDNEAIVAVADGFRRTYTELDRDVDALARGLVALGIEPGDRVGVWSTNHIEWVVLQFATARVGAILVNVNPANRVGELEHAMRLARVGTLFTIPSFAHSDYVAMLRELCPELETQQPGELRCARLPELRRVVVWDPSDPLRTNRPCAGFGTWQEVLEAGQSIDASRIEALWAKFDPDQPTNIQFTSGTTGFPKAVVLTHHNIVNNAYFVGRELGLTHEDRLCATVPFYHCFGMVLTNLLCVSFGATIVMPAQHFDPAATLRAVAAERCSVLHGVPTMFTAELDHPSFGEHDLSSLRTGIMAGAPCPPELVRRVIEQMGCEEILIGYGQTETSPCTHLTRTDDSFDRRTRSVGTNLPHQEAKIVCTETGAVVPRGATGELCFRGPHVMRGYFDDPEATARTIDAAHWLHSGDLGVMDEDGYVSITGRLKNMIIRGGENIYPAEIEKFFVTHPKVADVAVFGVPDERLGEAVAAWVKLRDGTEATADELRDFARDAIAHHKIPAHVWFVSEFPMTVTGKIQKHKIREAAAECMARGDVGA
ncbi:MAG: AMP-binding protein [Planctomycetes bacterium]|nr:AMP-binding protein [Planctomycetota bacterium]